MYLITNFLTAKTETTEFKIASLAKTSLNLKFTLKFTPCMANLPYFKRQFYLPDCSR